MAREHRYIGTYTADAFEKHKSKVAAYKKRKADWEDYLKAPSPLLLSRLADFLARKNLIPDDFEDYETISITLTHPYVALDWMRRGRPRESLNYDAMADVLKAATLVWGGVYEWYSPELSLQAPKATGADIMYLLLVADMGSYWKKRGIDRDDVPLLWEKDDPRFWITGETIRQGLKQTNFESGSESENR